MDGIVGEIRAFAFDYNPLYWIPCDGRVLSIYQYQTLYAVIGMNFGGDLSRQNFNVPDLRELAIMGPGAGPGLTPRVLYKKTGTYSVNLDNNTIPDHDHVVNGYVVQDDTKFTTTPVDNASFISNFFSKDANGNKTQLSGYVDPQTNPVILNPDSVSPIGGSMAHSNSSPCITTNFCICYEGLFPEPAQ